jgi:hypothetical protein
VLVSNSHGTQTSETHLKSDDDRGRVARIVAQIGDEADRAWLVDRLAEPWQRRARRLAERDAQIRELALTWHPLQSGRAQAAAIAVELGRYRAAAWRFEAGLMVPNDPRRAAWWKILHLSGGKGLSEGAVRAALAGVVIVGQKKPRKLATVAGRPVGFGLKSGSRRDVRGRETIVDRGQK